MPKNEDGEFELILGNRQLLGMFFIVVILFGVFFVMGYIVGQNSGPQGKAEVASAKKPEVKPLVVNGPDQPADSTPDAAPSPAPAPAETASQQPAETEKPKSKPQPEPAKPAPAPKAETKPAPAPAPHSNQPVAGQRYLQLAAIDKDHADSLVDLLRQKGFKALDAEVPEKPGIFRVLVGPVKDGEMSKLRSDLQAKSFPGNAGVPKVF